MKIIIFTQDDPFYINHSVLSFLSQINDEIVVDTVYLTEQSPFGSKKSFFNKAATTFQIFGTKFFLFYGIHYALSKLFNKSMSNKLKSMGFRVQPNCTNPNEEEICNYIQNNDIDLCISIACNKIFKADLIGAPNIGFLNLHTSELPKHAGLMPVFWALYNQDKKIGVTVFQVDEGIDTGPILLQEYMDITSSSLRKNILLTKDIGVNLLVKSIELIYKTYAEGKDVSSLFKNQNGKGNYNQFPTRKQVREFLDNGGRLP